MVIDVGVALIVVFAIIGFVTLRALRNGSLRKQLRDERKANAELQRRASAQHALLMQVYHMALGARKYEPVAVQIEQAINTHPLFLEELSS